MLFSVYYLLISNGTCYIPLKDQFDYLNAVFYDTFGNRLSAVNKALLRSTLLQQHDDFHIHWQQNQAHSIATRHEPVKLQCSKVNNLFSLSHKNSPVLGSQILT